MATNVAMEQTTALALSEKSKLIIAIRYHDEEIRMPPKEPLSEQQVEQMGEALMTLEQKVHELAKNFGLTPADLNLDLGPLGNLLQK